MTGWRFDPDVAGIEALTRGPAVAPALIAASREAQRNMTTLARGMHRTAFFDYPASIEVRPPSLHDGEMTAWVGSSSPGWHLVEFGTSQFGPRAIMRRALRRTASIRFDEGA